MKGAAEDAVVGYESVLPDGRILRCSTVLIRDVAGMLVAALCISTGTSMWRELSRVAGGVLGDLSVAAGMRDLPERVDSESSEMRRLPTTSTNWPHE